MCVSWCLSYSSLFQSDLLPPSPELVLHSRKHIMFVRWEPLGGIWEHKALAWVGYKLWRWGNKLPCEVYYSKFLDFFSVWEEDSVNHRWLCTREDITKHHGFIISTRNCAKGPSIPTKPHNASQVCLYYWNTPKFVHTLYPTNNSSSLQYTNIHTHFIL